MTCGQKSLFLFAYCLLGWIVNTLIEIFWSDLTFKLQSSRIYLSAGTQGLLLSTLVNSELALDSGKSGNFVAQMSNLTKKIYRCMRSKT